MITRHTFILALSAVAACDWCMSAEYPLADVVGMTNWQDNVTTRGMVVDAFPDDVDTKNSFLMLNDGSESLLVAVKAEFSTNLVNLLDAEVSVTGFFRSYLDGGSRWFSPPYLRVTDPVRDIHVLRNPPEDPFDIPELAYIPHATPKDIAGLGKCKITGTVLCCWAGHYVLIRTDRLRVVKLELTSGQDLPACGTVICSAGYPTTDFFKLILRNAVWKATNEANSLSKPQNVTAADILLENGRLSVQHKMLGRMIRIRGVVRAKPKSSEDRLLIENDGILVGVDRGTVQDRFEQIDIGSTVEVDGICVFEPEKQDWLSTFTRLNSFFVVLCHPDAINVVAAVSWWTPMRMTACAICFLAILVAILLWNRMLYRIISRRSHELAEEQSAHIDTIQLAQERSRLAVELHDSLSQNLAGIAFQVSTASDICTKDPEAAAVRLDVARRMLKSSRTELRRCLWDLRENTIDDPDFASALAKTLHPVSGNATLHIDFSAPRTRFTDSTAYAVLRILRELVSNAVVHGKSANIRVVGEWRDGVLSISVEDDGTGFDTSRHPGPEEGHFGLDGIDTRVRNLGGTFNLQSVVGKGTRASITLPTDLDTGDAPNEKR